MAVLTGLASNERRKNDEFRWHTVGEGLGALMSAHDSFEKRDPFDHVIPIANLTVGAVH